MTVLDDVRDTSLDPRRVEGEHTHSTYAPAWAWRGEPVPCVLTIGADELR